MGVVFLESARFDHKTPVRSVFRKHCECRAPFTECCVPRMAVMEEHGHSSDINLDSTSSSISDTNVHVNRKFLSDCDGLSGCYVKYKEVIKDRPMPTKESASSKTFVSLSDSKTEEKKFELPSDGNDKPAQGKCNTASDRDGNPKHSSYARNGKSPCGAGPAGGGGDGGAGGDGDGNGEEQWQKEVPADGVVKPKVRKKTEKVGGDVSEDHEDVDVDTAADFLGRLTENDRDISCLKKLELCVRNIIQDKQSALSCFLCMLLLNLLEHWCKCQGCGECSKISIVISYHVQNCVLANGFTCVFCQRLNMRWVSTPGTEFMTALAKFLGLALPDQYMELVQEFSQLSLTESTESRRLSSDRPRSLASIPEGDRASFTQEPTLQQAVSESMSSRRRRSTAQRPQSLTTTERVWRGAICVDYGNVAHLNRVACHWACLRTMAMNGTRLEECHNGIVLMSHKENIILSESAGGLSAQYQCGTNYRKLHVLGNGTSGVCYLCKDLSSGFLFCLKEMPLSKFKKDELMVWSRLTHEGVVKLFGAVMYNDSIHIIMEYVDGGTLFQHVQGQRKLNVRQSLIYLKEILEVLDYLMEKKVVHRDLKAENIMLSGGNLRLAVTDFGTASFLQDDQLLKNPVGTPTHNPPEVYMSDGHGFPVDIWAAICIFVHMLTGSPPWQRRYEGFVDTLAFKICTESPPLKDVPHGLPDHVYDLILKGWTVESSCRPLASALLQHAAFSLLHDAGFPSMRAESILYSGLTGMGKVSSEEETDEEDDDDDDDDDEIHDRALPPLDLLQMVTSHTVSQQSGSGVHGHLLPIMVENMTDNVDSTDDGPSDMHHVGRIYRPVERYKCSGRGFTYPPVLPSAMNGVEKCPPMAPAMTESKSLPAVTTKFNLAPKCFSEPARLPDSGIGSGAPASSTILQHNRKSSGSIEALPSSRLNSIEVNGDGFKDLNLEHRSTPVSTTPIHTPFSTPTSVKYGSTPPSQQPQSMRRDKSMSEKAEDDLQQYQNELFHDHLSNADFEIQQLEQSIEDLPLDASSFGPPSMTTLYLPADKSPNQAHCEVDGLTDEVLSQFRECVSNPSAGNGSVSSPKVLFKTTNGKTLAKAGISRSSSTWKEIIELASVAIHMEIGDFVCTLDGVKVILGDCVGMQMVTVICTPKPPDNNSWYGTSGRVRDENEPGHFEPNWDILLSPSVPHEGQ